MTKVPLFYDDQRGTKIKIGEADVTEVNGEYVVTGEITMPSFKNLIRDNALADGAPYDYSVGFEGNFPVEATEFPQPVQQLYKNVFDKED